MLHTRTYIHKCIKIISWFYLEFFLHVHYFRTDRWVLYNQLGDSSLEKTVSFLNPWLFIVLYRSVEPCQVAPSTLTCIGVIFKLLYRQSYCREIRIGAFLLSQRCNLPTDFLIICLFTYFCPLTQDVPRVVSLGTLILMYRLGLNTWQPVVLQFLTRFCFLYWPPPVAKKSFFDVELNTTFTECNVIVLIFT